MLSPELLSKETLELCANVSLLFRELDYPDRFAAAAEAGFDSAESWWPFSTAAPDEADIDQLVSTVGQSGIALTGLNFFAGDMAAGERGIVSWIGREEEFQVNLEVVTRIAARTGVRGFNALYGQRQSGVSGSEQDALAVANLSTAVRTVAEFGGTLYIEPLSQGLNGAYPLKSARDAVSVVERVRRSTGLDNIGLLFDTFHLTNNGDDLLAVLDEFASLVAHVQLADSPGRGEPGTGGIAFEPVLTALWNAGYRGTVACEYAPTTSSTLESLDWIAGMPHLRREASESQSKSR